MADAAQNALAAVADHERQATVDKLAADTVARLGVEEDTDGLEAATRAADGLLLGVIRWVATKQGGHARIAEIASHLHAEATAAVALQDAPGAGALN